MNARTLLQHIALYPVLARFARKKHIPKHVQGIAVPVTFGLWGVWYIIKGLNGYLTTDGREIPLHEMRLHTGEVVLGQEDLTAADGTKHQNAWRESYHEKIKERVDRTVN